MKKLFCILAIIVCADGCANISLKQRAVASLQASEAALESAQDFERSLCFVRPKAESGPHCTNPNAATVKLTDALHVKLARGFSTAFEVQMKAALALQVWRAGDPPPDGVADYQKDISDVLALAKALDPSAKTLIDQAQKAVDEGAKIALIVGVKP